MSTAAQALVAATTRLRNAGVESPARDARLLLAHAAQVETSRITLMGPETLSEDVAQTFDAFITQREQRRPVSHLLGFREFYGRAFQVGPDVLDPRPETETLIEAALAVPFASVLDVGTGSGCILLTLLSERENTVGTGVDLSMGACERAQKNAQTLGLSQRSEIMQSDWFSAVLARYDLIVSNPPYLAIEEMDHIAPELREYEPRMALTDEADGLTAYRILAQEGAHYLAPQGRIMVEIGWTQGAQVRAIFSTMGWLNIQVLPDLDGRDRVVCAQKPDEMT